MEDDLNDKVAPYFQKGNITIFHGKSERLIPRSLNSEHIDVLITEPSYSMDPAVEGPRVVASVAKALGKAAELLWSEGTALILCGSSGRSIEHFIDAVGLKWNRNLTWRKPNANSKAKSARTSNSTAASRAS